MATQTSPIPVLMTVRQFAEAHPWITEKALRGLIFRADSIGFSQCVRRIRGRVLLDVAAVGQWIENQNRAPIQLEKWRRRTKRVGKENYDGPA